MLINFVKPANDSQSSIAEAELIFESGEPLDGMKLIGFSVRRSHEGRLFVTLPARAFRMGTERSYFNFLRSAETRLDATQALRLRILKAWADVQST